MNKNIFIKTSHLYSKVESEKSSVYLMNDASINIEKGSSIGVVGESGSGKTQLLLSICGMQDLYPGVFSGNISFNLDKEVKVYDYKKTIIDFFNEGFSKKSLHVNKEMKKIKRDVIGFIPQDPKAYLNPYWKIKQLFNETYRLKKRDIDLDDFIEKYLKEVDISSADYKNKYPSQLSGGEAQRVMVALILSKEPKFLVADESTTGLDVTRQKSVIDLFKSVKKEHPEITMIFISHDFGFLNHVVDSYFIVYGGFICEHIKDKSFSNLDRQHPYTVDMINRLKGIKKDNIEDELAASANLSQELKNCPYYKQCDIIKNKDISFQNRCKNEIPPIIETSNSKQTNNLLIDWVRCWDKVDE